MNNYSTNEKEETNQISRKSSSIAKIITKVNINALFLELDFLQ